MALPAIGWICAEFRPPTNCDSRPSLSRVGTFFWAMAGSIAPPWVLLLFLLLYPSRDCEKCMGRSGGCRLIPEASGEWWIWCVGQTKRQQNVGRNCISSSVVWASKWGNGNKVVWILCFEAILHIQAMENKFFCKALCLWENLMRLKLRNVFSFNRMLHSKKCLNNRLLKWVFSVFPQNQHEMRPELSTLPFTHLKTIQNPNGIKPEVSVWAWQKRCVACEFFGLACPN